MAKTNYTNSRYRKPPGKLRDDKVIEENTMAPDGGYNYTQPMRFKKMGQIKSLFYRTMDLRGGMRSWKHIIAQYERLPYKGPDGQVLPNFGVLRGEVDKKLAQYTDYATERKRWFNIETDYEEASGNSTQWSEQISFAFQKYCVKKWRKKFSEILLGVRDMLLFSKGALAWLDELSCYPEHLCIENVWPDANARMFADSFDVLFIRRVYTAQQLYDKVKDEGEAMGWRKSAVMSVLRSSMSQWRKYSDRTIFLKFRNRNVTADEMDHEIDCVWAYVTEYRKGSEPKVSRFVFPECGCIPEDVALDRNADPQPDDDRVGYMCYQPDWKESMNQAVTIMASTVCTNFYEDPSFAELLYVSAKTYDIVINRILCAVEDNMRVYLQSGTTDQMKKLARMRHNNFLVFEPGMKLVQDRIERPVRDAMTVIQMVKGQQRENQGSIDDPDRSQPRSKTAHEAALEFSKGQEVSSSSLKIFNQFLGNMGEEMFRRFTHPARSSGYEYEQLQKFKAYLAARHVPEAAWDTENVTVESVVDLGAGSPAARLQAAQVTLQALSVPAASPGERQAQRDMIAAAKGIENVKLYLPDDEELNNVPELRTIGMENDLLSEAGANPANVQVRATDLQMLHIQGHMADAQSSLQAVGRYLQGLGQLNPEDLGIHLKSIQDQLIGIDNKLAHTAAHMQLAGRDKKNKAKMMQLKKFAQGIQQINKAKDGVEKQVAQIQQSRMKQAQQKGAQQDPELTHMQRKWQMEEEHLAKMNQLDLQRHEQKGDQLRQQSALNADHKRNLATLETATDLQMKEAEHAVKVGATMREHNVKVEMAKKSPTPPSNGTSK